MVHGRSDFIYWICELNIVDINDQSYNFFSNACIFGLTEIIKYLLEKYTIGEYHFNRGFSESCTNNHIHLAKWLFKHRPNTSIPKELFSKVCSAGNYDIAMWLLEIKPEIDITFNIDRAFCNLCIEGNLQMVERLFSLISSRGLPSIDITANNYIGFVSACMYDHLEMVIWLQQMGPFDCDYHYIIERCVQENSNTTLLYLIKNQDIQVDYTKLFIIACSNSNLYAAKMFSEHNIEECLSQSFVLACKYAHYNIVSWLIDNYGNYDLPFEEGFREVFTRKHIITSDGDFLVSKLDFDKKYGNGRKQIVKALIYHRPEIDIFYDNFHAFTSCCIYERNLINFFVKRSKYGDTRLLHHDNNMYIINSQQIPNRWFFTTVNGVNISSFEEPDMKVLTDYMATITVHKSARS
jgi:hypothetical protein